MNDKNKIENGIPCQRCGECCLAGGPGLHVEDVSLFREQGGPDLAHVMTLRAGERVHDQPAGKFMILESEMLKIASVDGGTACAYYNASAAGCNIYKYRPIECRVLNCRDTGPLEEIYARDRLSRRDFIPDSHPLSELIAEHNEQCPARFVDHVAVQAAAGKFDQSELNELARIMAYDAEIRNLVPKKTGLDPNEMEFLFGRPPEKILRAHGIKILRNEDSITLSPRNG